MCQVNRALNYFASCFLNLFGFSFVAMRFVLILIFFNRTANQPNSDIAWLAVVILSHGRRRKGEDEILGVNGEGVVVDEVEKKLLTHI